MMNGLKKSDEAVRPVRAANKGARASAESPEERASTKGNPDCQSTRRTQCRVSVPQAAARIRKAAERNPKERLTALFHHITPDALGAAYFALKKDAAAGVDGVTWDMYGEGLDEAGIAALLRPIRTVCCRSPTSSTSISHNIEPICTRRPVSLTAPARPSRRRPSPTCLNTRRSWRRSSPTSIPSSSRLRWTTRWLRPSCRCLRPMAASCRFPGMMRTPIRSSRMSPASKPWMFSRS